MGRIKRKKGASLSVVYLKYLLIMLVSLCVLFIGMVCFFNLLLMKGKILPANYTEKKINEATEMLLKAEEVTQDLIPPLCRYVVFNQKGDVIGGDLPKEDTEMAWEIVSGQRSKSNIYFYKVIERSDGYCVLQYRLIPQYSSAYLRNHLIPPQTLLTATAFSLAFAIIIVSSLCFGKKIKNKLNPLLDIVEKIKEQELSYDISYTGIKEIDDIIASINDMKIALKDSLETQWRAEQEKNRQMSALAHDIKTPLTVVRGNAELLEETGLTEEQKKYAAYILSSAVQMQAYVQMLIEVTKSVEGYHFKPEQVKTAALLEEIKNQSMGLANVHKLKINWAEHYSNKFITVAYEQFVRAVMNIVTNAAEHTPKGGTIDIRIQEKEEKIFFVIEDGGSGFSPEALKHGTEQFFMDDVSRSGQLHYGIGLFSAKTIVEKHGGKLTLENSERTGGAKVCITLPVKTDLSWIEKG